MIMKATDTNVLTIPMSPFEKLVSSYCCCLSHGTTGLHQRAAEKLMVVHTFCRTNCILVLYVAVFTKVKHIISFVRNI